MSSDASEPEGMGLDDPELVDSFLQEAREFLAAADHTTSQLAQDPETDREERISTVFRSVHSVKGAAGFLGLDSVYRLALALEKMVKMIQTGKLELDRDNLDLVRSAIDYLRQLIDAAGRVDEDRSPILLARIQALTEV